MKMKNKILCGIECGGTTHKVIFANNNYTDILSNHTIKTEGPLKVWKEITGLITKFDAEEVCIASFGPVILEGNKTGRVISYTKPEWDDFNIYDYVLKTTGIVPSIIHDCHAGALAELIVSERLFKDKILYITIGTGIGIGLVENGKIIKDKRSLEAGHSFVRIKKEDHFKGSCKVHGDCLEGLASATALASRLGLRDLRDLESVDKDHELWSLAGYYIGMFAYNMFLTLLPSTIILGGGISNNVEFVKSVIYNFDKINNNYVGKEYGFKETIIRINSFNGNQGVMGCLYYLVGKKEM